MPDSPPPERNFRIRDVFHVLSLASTWLAGVLGSLVVWRLGDSLAMGAQMWAAMNTEPRRPLNDFPVWSTIVVAALPLPLALTRRWRTAQIASLLFVGWPWWHFHSLYLQAGAS